jgi:hypothetical protein
MCLGPCLFQLQCWRCGQRQILGIDKDGCRLSKEGGRRREGGGAIFIEHNSPFFAVFSSQMTVVCVRFSARRHMKRE